ncbi:YrhK family protein [Halalkalibacter kiskunsagensis]|uniref:YrhK family protein n=1 Tax=Halalkalibacter kiskunsagensis TaxID=1548599 RepID=A0ABV6KE83_9BACI
MPIINSREDYFDMKIGRFRLLFHKRYRVIKVINDLLIGLLFITGSCLNFFPATEPYGNICYLLGSTFLVGRPILKLMHSISLRRELKGKHTSPPK